MSPNAVVPKKAKTKRTLWEFVGHTLVILSALTGAGYIVGGKSLAKGTNYYILTHYVPLGIQFHGIIMILLSLGLLVVLHRSRFDKWGRLVTGCYVAYGLFIGCVFVSSWFVTGVIEWGGPGWWFAFAFLAEGLVIYPPPHVDTPIKKAANGVRKIAR